MEIPSKKYRLIRKWPGLKVGMVFERSEHRTGGIIVVLWYRIVPDKLENEFVPDGFLRDFLEFAYSDTEFFEPI